MENQIRHKSDHYNLDYLGTDQKRLNSYLLQIFYTMKSKSQSVLIIGKGDGIVVNILKLYIKNIYTIDIINDIKPDVVGSVNNLPIKNSYFDACLCCQVLEHLPYIQFVNSLKELRRITRGYLILSLPDIRRYISIRIKIFKKFHLNAERSFERIFPNEFPTYDINTQHYWEIGYKNYNLNRIVKDIKEAGWNILEIKRVTDFTYHTFFYCK